MIPPPPGIGKAHRASMEPPSEALVREVKGIVSQQERWTEIAKTDAKECNIPGVLRSIAELAQYSDKFRKKVWDVRPISEAVFLELKEKGSAVTEFEIIDIITDILSKECGCKVVIPPPEEYEEED